mgnify:CR=1 FL=1|tara:strand:+ start:15803 stop:16273 length:471 start_codon:yes stop_codon:yes gene_type:complete
MSIFDEIRTLAGVNEKQKMGSPGQAKGKDPTPKTSTPSKNGSQPHPLKDKLVGEDDIDTNRLSAAISALKSDLDSDDPNILVARGLQKAVAGETLTPNERNALSPYVGLITKLLTEPRFRSSLVSMNRILKGQRPKEQPKEESVKDQLYHSLRNFK